MKTYQEIRKQSEDKLSDLIRECGVFFAFSNSQFAESKTPLKEGDKYVSIGHGGYMPKSNVKMFMDGQDEIEAWEKQEIKAAKQLKEDHITFELNNHECLYTGDISDALVVLPYPKKDVSKVYNKLRLTWIKE